MQRKRQTFSVFQVIKLFLVYSVVVTVLCGCADEVNNPFAVEELNGDPPKQELAGSELDTRGIVNGVYYPEGGSAEGSSYPVRYTGSWSFKKQVKSSWYMVTTDEVGARVDFTATMSRIIFEFWDYEMYDNPGSVRFEIDGKDLGTFELAREAQDDLKYLSYQITTQKNDVATVSMILESGRVVIAGFDVIFLDERYPY